MSDSRLLLEIDCMKNFNNEIHRFRNGTTLDADSSMYALYDWLFNYYMDIGEIPYGVAKARTGDPIVWVSDRFSKDLGII